MRKIAFAAMTLTALVLFSATAQAAPRNAEQSQKALSGVVNINTASEAQLVLLPGVGKAIAQRIVDHRARQPFQRIDELLAVKGIGQRTFQRISPYLTVSGPTTLAEERQEKTARRALPERHPEAQMAPAALDTLAYA